MYIYYYLPLSQNHFKLIIKFFISCPKFIIKKPMVFFSTFLRVCTISGTRGVRPHCSDSGAGLTLALPTVSKFSAVVTYAFLYHSQTPGVETPSRTYFICVLFPPLLIYTWILLQYLLLKKCTSDVIKNLIPNYVF